MGAKWAWFRVAVINEDGQQSRISIPEIERSFNALKHADADIRHGVMKMLVHGIS